MIRLILLALAVITCAPAAAAETDDDEPQVQWKHPYLKARQFNYRHEDWNKVKTKELWAFSPRSEETWEREADGNVLFTWSMELEIREPGGYGNVLYLAHLDSSRDAEVVSFEGTYTGGGRIDVLDRSRLIDLAPDPDSKVIDQDVSLGLLLPQDRKGKLVFKVVTRAAPAVGLEDYFGGAVLIQEPASVEARTIRLIVPEDEELVFEQRHFRTQPEVVVADGKRSYTFEFETVFGAWGAAGMPHPYDAFPTLFFSNQPTLADLGSLLSNAWEPELVATDAMKAWAEELCEGKASIRDRALAIHDAVADGWGYLGFYPRESGWIPHQAEVCFAERLGDCKDQTALMVTLMRSVGVEAHPAVVMAGTPLKRPKVPTKASNHAIVWVEDPEHERGGFALDSVDAGLGAEPVGASLQGRQLLVMEPGDARYEGIPVAPKESRLRELHSEVAFDEAGVATVQVLQRWHGEEANHRAVAHRRTAPSVWERAQREALVGAVAGGSLVALEEGPDPEQPGTWVLRATLTSSSLLVRSGEQGLLSLPWVQRYSDSVGVDKWRIHPRVQAGLWNRLSVTVALPPGVELLSHPPDVVEDREDWVSALTTEVGDRTLTLRLDVEAKPGRVSSKKDGVRSNFYRHLSELQRRPVVLLLPEAS